MRLRLFERLRRIVSRRSHDREDSGRHRRNPAAAPPPRQSARPPQPAGSLPPWQVADAWPADSAAEAPGTYAPQASARPASRGGGVGRARIREVPFGAAPMESLAVGREAHLQPPAPARPRHEPRQEMPRQPWYQVVSGPAVAQRQAAHTHSAPPAGPAALPFAPPHPMDLPPTADGRRNCGTLEQILWRQWDAETGAPPPEVIAAIDRLAEFPRALQEKLAAGLDAIYVGSGGVPELDDMAALHGVALPSGRATWDACAGAYGERKIVVGSRPSPTPDVMCHEVGHALDDLDSPQGKWQSDSPEFRIIYDLCQSYIASDFHRQRGGLGRKEFFADAFAAIASAQRPALVDMLSGNTRIALQVMLYFNRRYGI
jgi:hypothetical protein